MSPISVGGGRVLRKITFGTNAGFFDYTWDDIIQTIYQICSLKKLEQTTSFASTKREATSLLQHFHPQTLEIERLHDIHKVFTPGLIKNNWTIQNLILKQVTSSSDDNGNDAAIFLRNVIHRYLPRNQLIRMVLNRISDDLLLNVNPWMTNELSHQRPSHPKHANRLLHQKLIPFLLNMVIRDMDFSHRSSFLYQFFFLYSIGLPHDIID
jgi:hypothetical protein